MKDPWILRLCDALRRFAQDDNMGEYCAFQDDRGRSGWQHGRILRIPGWQGSEMASFEHRTHGDGSPNIACVP